MATRAMTDDSSIVLLGRVLEEKLERCRNVRVTARGLRKLLPDNRICLCVTRFSIDSGMDGGGIGCEGRRAG